MVYFLDCVYVTSVTCEEPVVPQAFKPLVLSVTYCAHLLRKSGLASQAKGRRKKRTTDLKSWLKRHAHACLYYHC